MMLGCVFVFLAVLSAMREPGPFGATPGLLFGAAMVCMGLGEGLSLRRRHLAAALRLCGVVGAGSGLVVLAAFELARGGPWGLVGLLSAMAVVAAATARVLSDRTRGGRIEAFLSWVGSRDVPEGGELARGRPAKPRRLTMKRRDIEGRGSSMDANAGTDYEPLGRLGGFFAAAQGCCFLRAAFSPASTEGARSGDCWPSRPFAASCRISWWACMGSAPAG